MTRANIHSAHSPPRLHRLLTASRCRHFHSRISSPRAASQHTGISASSSVRANLTIHVWPFCGKKSGSDVSSALCCVMGADRVLRLDLATDADTAALGKAGESRFRSISRSSFESRSRSRVPISGKPVKEAVREHDAVYRQQLAFLFPRCE